MFILATAAQTAQPVPAHQSHLQQADRVLVFQTIPTAPAPPLVPPAPPVPAHLPLKVKAQLVKSASPFILICNIQFVGVIVNVLDTLHAVQDE